MSEYCDERRQIRKTFLPYAKQSIDEDDIQAVVNTLKSDYITTGPEIDRFEKNFANYVGANYAVAFSTGTAALHAACFAAGIKKGDEVITTPLTFAASANCILYQDGRPIFADIDEKTYNMDPDKMKEKITKQTKAIIPVHFTGQPVNLDEILKIAEDHQLIVIEDAAHALGSSYKGRKIGTFGDMTIFSFHPVKHITTGEGGMITTNHKGYYEKLKQFRTHGMTRNREKLLQDKGQWYYEMQFLGFNYRMTDLQAALGNSQLQKLEHFLNKRRNIAKMYNLAFKQMEEVITPYQMEEGVSSWHLYVIRLNSRKFIVSRNRIYDDLRGQNIGVNVHYLPVYLHPYYQQLGYKKGICPIAEKMYEEIITLPLYPSMTEKDVEDVVNAVKRSVQRYSINKSRQEK